MMDEIQTYLGADGLMHCTVCKEPVEAFYPKGSLLEMKKHHRQCACERQAYAEEAQYFKEKERRELVVRNKKICFEEKEMEGFTFQNVDRDSSAIRIAEEYVANWQKMKQNHMGYLFWGPVGTGKSYLAACIANALLEQEVTVKMTNFNTILNDLFAAEDKTEYIRSLNGYELLIIDDLGVERNSEYALENIFSGWSFRRTVRTYKNTYVRWVCSGRNGRGVDSCPNKTVVDEEELIEVLQEYFTNVLKQKKKVIAHVVNEFQRVYKAKDENVEYEKELNAELAKLQKTRQKYMDMYTDDLISREELNEKIGGSRQEMERIENELKMVSYHLTKGEQLENILNNTFKEIEDITDVHQMTNQQLKRLIQKIEVDKEGNVDIYLRLLGDLGLDESVLIEENETVLNCDDQT